MNVIKVLLSLSFFFLASCQTLPDYEDDGTDVGVWEGKVRFVDPLKSKKIWGYVSWVSDSVDSRLRVDVRAIFDVQIATFLLENNQAQLWLYQEDKHYISDDPEKLFKRMVRLTIDPQVFFSLLKKEPGLKPPWDCKKHKQSLTCREAQKNVKMVVQNNGHNIRRLKFVRKNKVLTIHLERSKVQVEDKMFSPPASSRFEKIQI